MGETDVCRRMVRPMVRTLQLQPLSPVRARRPPCESQTASLQTRTSQFLKLNLFPLSLSTHTPCAGCFPGNPAHAAARPTRPTQPTRLARAPRRYGDGLPARGPQTRCSPVIPDTASQVHPVDAPGAVEGEGFVQYLPKSLASPWQAAVGAPTPSAAEAEGRDACAEAGGARSERAAAGAVLGTQRENYSHGNLAR